MPIHENSLKNLKPGRKKGSKNKKKLTKEDVKKLIDQTEDLKIKAQADDLSKDDLVEVFTRQLCIPVKKLKSDSNEQ